MLKNFIVLAVLMSVSSSAMAAGYATSGNDMLTFCSNPDEPDRTITAYAWGWDEGMNLGVVVGGKDDKALKYCLPPRVTPEQMGRVFCRYLKDNPAKTSAPMFLLVAAAFEVAWPCKAP